MSSPASVMFFVLVAAAGIALSPRIASAATGVVRHVDCDFDGDGRTDPTVFQPSQGLWFSLLSRTSTTQTMQWGWSQVEPVPADYDGDGITDYAVYHRNMGNWYILCSSNGRMLRDGPINWGYSGALAVPSDYDGDGRADLAVMEKSSNRWYVISSRTGQMLGGKPIRLESPSTLNPVPADLDGDGKADFVGYDAMVGSWYMQTSRDGLQTRNCLGGTVPYPVPADYTGIGTARVVLFGNASGNWYNAIPPTNQYASTETWTLGVYSLPVPGDYDGDGKMDLAVYDTSKGAWLIRRSSDGKALRGGGFVFTAKRAFPVHLHCLSNRHFFGNTRYAAWWEANMSGWW